SYSWSTLILATVGRYSGCNLDEVSSRDCGRACAATVAVGRRDQAGRGGRGYGRACGGGVRGGEAAFDRDGAAGGPAGGRGSGGGEGDGGVPHRCLHLVWGGSGGSVSGDSGS